MTRTELQERIDYCQRELAWLQGVQIDANCTRCQHKDITTPGCSKYGPIPPEFLLQGCAEWDFDEVPF